LRVLFGELERKYPVETREVEAVPARFELESLLTCRCDRERQMVFVDSQPVPVRNVAQQGATGITINRDPTPDIVSYMRPDGGHVSIHCKRWANRDQGFL
jgi:hypothetical protein